MLYQAGQATQELFDINPDTGDNYATAMTEHFLPILTQEECESCHLTILTSNPPKDERVNIFYFLTEKIRNLL